MPANYSLNSKIEALNLLDQHDGDFHLVKSKLKIPLKTLRGWRVDEDKLRHQYEDRQYRHFANIKLEILNDTLESARDIMKKIKTGDHQGIAVSQLAYTLTALLNQANQLEDIFEDLAPNPQKEEEPNRIEYVYDNKAQDAPPWAARNPEKPARFKVLACGRRWGKSELGKTKILEAAHLEHKRCWWVAPTYQMASQIWRDLVNSVKHLAGVKISATERRIDLLKGGMIAVRSAHNPDKLRGDGLDFVVLDEAAWMPARIWHDVIRPMLARARGAACLLSTPRGRNWFWQRHRVGLDPMQEEWQSFHFTSADSKLIHPDELQSIQQSTPEIIWNAEYEAKFMDDRGQVFRRISDAAAAAPYDQPQPGHAYVAGVDWGRSKDYTAIAVLDAANKKMVALDRFNQVGWELQRDRLASIVKKWRPQVIWAEANSIGEPNIDALVQQGLPIRRFYTSAKSKAPLIESLALAIERSEITLLDDPVLLGELADYELERLPNGSYRYGSPLAGHDDTVIATALAWYGSQFIGSPLAFA